MTILSAKACIFCGRSGSEVKITKEHVLPQWLRSCLTVPVAPGLLELRSGGVVVDKRDSVLFNVAPKIACVDCNTGWMHDLEERARPLLLPMLDGLPQELDLKEQATVAAWSVKTCFTMLHARIGLPKIAPPRHHRYLWKHLGRAIPPEMDVLVAMDDTHYLIEETGATLIVSFSPRRFAMPEQNNDGIYVLNLRINRFVVSVAGPDIARRQRGVRQGPYPGEGSHVLRLAPSPKLMRYKYPPRTLKEVGGFSSWADWTPHPRLTSPM